MINRAYKFRIYPTKAQEQYLARAFGHTRFLYNKLLSEKKEAYEKEKKSITKGQSQSRILTLKEEFPWLKEIHSQTLQGANHNLFSAYERFFKGLGEFPKFKKKGQRNCFSVPQFFQVDPSNNVVSIPKLKTPIKTKFHRSLKSVKKMNSLTISKEPTGKYYVSINVEDEDISSSELKAEVGIDLGIKSLIVESNGNKVESPSFFRKSEKKLKRLSRKLSKKKIGSKNRNKQRHKVALLHEKIKHQRKDFLHKISARLTNENQVIYLEDLNVKGMIRNRHLSKSIADASWGELCRQLSYKAKWKQRRVVEIGRFEASSQLCSIPSCDYKNTELKLSDREWICPKCGALHDRDVNAARNIEKIGRDTSELKSVEELTSVSSSLKKQVGPAKQKSLASNDAR